MAGASTASSHVASWSERGLTRREIEDSVAAGGYGVHRGVYAVGHESLTGGGALDGGGVGVR